jgi:predicted dehydrogenase
MGAAVSAAALTGMAQTVRPSRAVRFRKAEEKLNMAFIGSGGRGNDNLGAFYDLGENIVAVCDIDKGRLNGSANKVKERCPDVRSYLDWRELLAKEADLDAVVVSTPDHVHASAAITAMRMGCHAYIEKPVVRTIWEAHYLEKVAKANGVCTQQGNQGSAGDGLRRTVEILHAGVLGDVKEVHVWTNRPVWRTQGKPAPTGEDPVPDHLDWDAWLGPAKARPYKSGDVYHKFHWRGFVDFGTGAFGDMACHTMNLPFRGLKLGAVTSAECQRVEGRNKDSYPAKSIVKMVYAARGRLPPVDLFWYDGNLKPSADIMPQVIATLGEVPGTGCLILGSKGTLVSTNDYGDDSYIGFKGDEKMTSTKRKEAFEHIPQSIPRNRGGQHKEFVNACKGEDTCYSDVDHSVPMLEGMLVGCIAQQVPGLLRWDTARQTFGNKEADALLRPYVRKGWEYWT